uniref:hypothetical protein n=1 Tax=Orrella sp. TaxID=1921583 RepID=UPI0040475826
MRKNLRELAVLNNSNKLRHDYESVYEPYFRTFRDDLDFKMLEIGIFQGGSVRTFRDYFDFGHIYAIDINPIAVRSVEGEERITPFVCNQGDIVQLTGLMEQVGMVDIVLDDGSHCMDHMQISFGGLFEYVKSGGVYIIEDLHTSWPYHNVGEGNSSDRNIDSFRKRWHIEKDFLNTTYVMIKNYLAFGEIRSKYIPQENLEYINANIADIDLNIRNNFGSATCIISKK